MNKLITFSCLFNLLITIGYGQNQIDLSKFPSSVHDSLYYEMFKSNRETDITLALSYAQKTYDLSRDQKHNSIFLKACNGLGYIYQSQAIPDYDKALYYHFEGLEVSKQIGALDRQMFTYNNLAFIYIKLDVLDKALDYLFKALELSLKLKNEEVESICQNNIGVVYGKLKNYQEAVNYCTRSREILLKNGGTYFDESYINIALYYIEMDEFDKAKAILNEFVGAEKKDINNNLLTMARNGLAKISLLQGDFDMAIKEGQLAIKANEGNDNTDYLIQSKITLSRAFIKKEKYGEALNLLNSASEQAVESKAIFLLEDIFKLSSDIKTKQGLYKEAYDFLIRSNEMRDSVFTQSFAENFKNVHLKLEKEKSDEIISSKNISISESRDLIATLIFTASVLMLVIGLIFYFNRIIQNKNKELVKAKSEVEIMNVDLETRVKERTSELTKANHELDIYIYKTSHDIKGPLVRLKGLINLIEKDPANIKDYLEKLGLTVESLNDLLTRVQMISIIQGHSAEFKKIDTQEMIGKLLEAHKNHTNYPMVRVILTLSNSEIISDEKMLEIALANLFLNALNYNKASVQDKWIEIESTVEGEECKIRISDNGVGIPQELQPNLFELFSKGADTKSVGLGLHLTRLAIEKCGGTIRFIPGFPTCFEISLPQRIS